jgi:hypothetical protein
MKNALVNHANGNMHFYVQIMSGLETILKANDGCCYFQNAEHKLRKRLNPYHHLHFSYRPCWSTRVFTVKGGQPFPNWRKIYVFYFGKINFHYKNIKRVKIEENELENADYYHPPNLMDRTWGFEWIFTVEWLSEHHLNSNCVLSQKLSKANYCREK